MKLTIKQLKESIRSALAESDSYVPPEFDSIFRETCNAHHLLDFSVDPQDADYNPFTDPEFKPDSFWLLPSENFMHVALMKGPNFVVFDPDYSDFEKSGCRIVWYYLDGYIDFQSYLSKKGML